ncbi:protein ovarian tumor locus isoform X2 [Drosophila elegans]|uniref:protein ovarian tumor locus isoform X2 n=1 Tax=Drosophila elegans TaxID=30023 RepID=UPI001BC8544B|nr:protein ovarian tumor locus isoform X2 [Drosophila elegans]
MMSGSLKRSVSLGSKNPMDRFLERHLLFRKHIVLDSSSLFRAIAEQVYDTQMLHHEVRMECVRYMFRKRVSFRNFVEGDYDEYLLQLEKPRTAGTLLELRVLCHLYRRNVVLHKPFDLGQLLIFGDSYPETLRIFVDRHGHFDSVLTMSEIETAAVCQAVAFKMLYERIFCLPDVSLAVDWMLYPETFKWGTDLEFDRRANVIRLVCSNGRSYQLDRPEHTRCVLKNYQECPFHNQKLELHEENFRSMPVSCMRRIFEHHCLPFCFTVAKSLNPYMYRNVELSCLIAARREAKALNIYTGDYDFKVGAKCQVALDANLHCELSICHIQAIDKDNSACEVFVEGQGKLLTVPYDSLHPLPPSEFKPWDRDPKRRSKLPGLLKMSTMKRQFLQLENASNSKFRCQDNKPHQDFKNGVPADNKISEVLPTQYPPLIRPPPVQDNQLVSLPESTPKSQFRMLPPMAIRRPVFVPPSFVPPGMMQHDQRFIQLHRLMIRPPGPVFFVAPPGSSPPPGMLPVLIGNSPLMIQLANDTNPPPAEF